MTSPPDKNFFPRIFKAFGFSMNGMKAAFRTEAAFRQEVVLALFMIPCALWLGTTTVERALLIASVLLVLMMEILNSAIERIVDRVSLERHELSKEAKDMGSAAVLLSLVLAGVIWVMIGIDRFFMPPELY
ncbi:diacylglycerol kinase [Alphaproteobacteria bacterium]|nr:diacylglycerol kinase [Alphaproteobacteria bacterium]